MLIRLFGLRRAVPEIAQPGEPLVLYSPQPLAAPAPVPRLSSTFAAAAMQGAPRFQTAQAAALGQGAGVGGGGQQTAPAAARGQDLLIATFNVGGTNFEHQGDSNFEPELRRVVAALVRKAAP